MRDAGRRNPTVVTDASVALKWELDDEEHVDRAVALRDDFLRWGRVQLFAPHLFVFELTNGITTAVRRLRLAPERGEQILERLLLVEVSLQVPPMGQVYTIALDFGLSAYDSAYVALAGALQAELWTADRQLYEATHGGLPWVRWIGEYPLAGAA